MIEFQNVSKTYLNNYSEPNLVLDDLSFKIDDNEFVSIVGKSAAGKTTLFKLLLSEEKPSKGKIFFEGQEINKIKMNKLPAFRKKIGAIFQDYKLLSDKTVYENVSYIMQVIGATDEQIENDVPRVLELVGLTDRMQSFPAELSGGEKQRVAIARALIHHPKVILADEPTGNLDPYHTLEIINLLLKINRLGTTVVLATHNRETINSLGKRVITLSHGRIIKDDKIGKFIL